VSKKENSENKEKNRAGLKDFILYPQKKEGTLREGSPRKSHGRDSTLGNKPWGSVKLTWGNGKKKENLGSEGEAQA